MSRILLGKLGRVIQKERRAQGLNQQQLARRCKVTAVSISNIENVKANPSICTLSKIYDSLGLELDFKYKKLRRPYKKSALIEGNKNKARGSKNRLETSKQ